MRRFCFICLAFFLLLSGCAAKGVTFVKGETLSHAEQQSLYESRIEQQGEPDVSGKGEVYFTPSGTKYHKDPDCSYLSGAKQVLSGSIAEAVNHGAKSPCSRCGGQ